MQLPHCICAVKTLYQNSGRAYHNIDHINNMLDVAKKLYYSVYKIPMTLELYYAIYYHDIVYDPKRTDNESASAYYYLSKKCNVDDDLVVGLINITSMHMLTLDDNQISNVVGVNNIMLGKIMLDADLAGFADKENYTTNSKNIRLEYNHCDDYEYSQGRIKFLNIMLNKPNIYYTKYAQELYESDAKKNIATEIDCLRLQCTL